MVENHIFDFLRFFLFFFIGFSSRWWLGWRWARLSTAPSPLFARSGVHFSRRWIFPLSQKRVSPLSRPCFFRNGPDTFFQNSFDFGCLPAICQFLSIASFFATFRVYLSAFAFMDSSHESSVLSYTPFPTIFPGINCPFFF